MLYLLNEVYNSSLQLHEWNSIQISYEYAITIIIIKECPNFEVIDDENSTFVNSIKIKILYSKS